MTMHDDDRDIRDEEGSEPLVDLLASDDEAVESLDALMDEELDAAEIDEDDEYGNDPFTAYNGGDEEEDGLYSAY